MDCSLFLIRSHYVSLESEQAEGYALPSYYFNGDVSCTLFILNPLTVVFRLWEFVSRKCDWGYPDPILEYASLIWHIIGFGMCSIVMLPLLRLFLRSILMCICLSLVMLLLFNVSVWHFFLCENFYPLVLLLHSSAIIFLIPFLLLLSLTVSSFGNASSAIGLVVISPLPVRDPKWVTLPPLVLLR